jgi:hypothetical protein
MERVDACCVANERSAATESFQSARVALELGFIANTVGPAQATS